MSRRDDLNEADKHVTRLSKMALQQQAEYETSMKAAYALGEAVLSSMAI